MMIDSGTENVRQKYVHQQGIVTKARFVPNELSDRGYSGIFESGSDEVIVRFSEAGQHLDGISQSVNPSIALKFLRSGVNSANQFGMIGFDNAKAGQWNFWENSFKSMLPDFKNSDSKKSMCKRNDVDEEGNSIFEEVFNHSKVFKGECTPLTMGRWMSQVDGHIYQNGNVDLATFNQDGERTPNEELIIPYELEFVPNMDVLTPTDSESRWYKQLVQSSQSINEWDVLFEVRARGMDADGTLSNFETIGEIVQGDAIWTESLWGDERLFFSHNIITNDIRDF